METILWQEEAHWFQKSREQGVQFGYGNTRFFHAQTVVRRKRNKIMGLFLLDGSWSTDPQIMQHEAMIYFNGLFANTENVNPSTLVI